MTLLAPDLQLREGRVNSVHHRPQARRPRSGRPTEAGPSNRNAGLIVLLALVVVAIAWRQRSTTGEAIAIATLEVPMGDRVHRPVAGILDLTAGASRREIEADTRVALRRFERIVRSVSSPPRSDVLFIYAHVDADGTVNDSDLSIRQIVAQAGAAIAVMATPNGSDGWASAPDPDARPASGAHDKMNLVVTLDRVDGAFGRFFARLFEAMHSGESLAKAWQRLAPQGSPSRHSDLPALIFICERGDVAFVQN